MKAVVAAFNQEKALVGAFSVITNLRIAIVWISKQQARERSADSSSPDSVPPPARVRCSSSSQLFVVWMQNCITCQSRYCNDIIVAKWIIAGRACFRPVYSALLSARTIGNIHMRHTNHLLRLNQRHACCPHIQWHWAQAGRRAKTFCAFVNWRNVLVKYFAKITKIKISPLLYLTLTENKSF